MRPLKFLLVSLLTAASLLAPSVAEATSWSVTVSRSTTWVTLGQSFTLTGKVSNSFKGAPVELERYDGRAVVIKKFTTGAYGAYSVSWTPQSLGARQYRVCRPAGGAYTRGCSGWVTVTAYRWLDLVTLTPYSSHEMDYEYETANINGTFYTASIRDSYPDYDVDYIEYNLNRKCKTLKSTYGLDTDQSDTGSTGRIVVSSDGNLRYQRDFGIGQSDNNRYISMDNALRIRIEMNNLTNDSGADATGALGRPRVLCSF